MIIYEDKGFETRSDMPNADWTGEALFVVPDGSELAEKIQRLYPYYDFILNDAGELVDVVEIEHDDPEPVEEVQTIEDQITDIQETLIDHEYRLVLTELGLTEV